MPQRDKPTSDFVNIQGEPIISTVSLCEYKVSLVLCRGLFSCEMCLAFKPPRQVTGKRRSHLDRKINKGHK